MSSNAAILDERGGDTVPMSYGIICLARSLFDRDYVQEFRAGLLEIWNGADVPVHTVSPEDTLLVGDDFVGAGIAHREAKFVNVVCNDFHSPGKTIQFKSAATGRRFS